MIGLDVTHKALFTAEHAERLAAPGAGRAVAEIADFFLVFHPASGTASTVRRSTTRWPSRT